MIISPQHIPIHVLHNKLKQTYSYLCFCNCKTNLIITKNNKGFLIPISQEISTEIPTRGSSQILLEIILKIHSEIPSCIIPGMHLEIS